MVREVKKQQEGQNRKNEEESNFKAHYLILPLPDFPKVGVVNHNFTDRAAETQRGEVTRPRSPSRERFQPQVSLNSSHCTTFLLCILQLGDTAEWDQGSRVGMRAGEDHKVVYSSGDVWKVWL